MAETFPGSKLPYITSIKPPVMILKELYSKYQEGGSFGWFAYVHELKGFAFWDFEKKSWEPVIYSDGSSGFAIQAEEAKNIAVQAKLEAVLANEEVLSLKASIESLANQVSIERSDTIGASIAAQASKSQAQLHELNTFELNNNVIILHEQTASLKNETELAKNITIENSLSAINASNLSINAKDITLQAKDNSLIYQIICINKSEEAKNAASQSAQSSLNAFQYKEISETAAGQSADYAQQALSLKNIVVIHANSANNSQITALDHKNKSELAKTASEAARLLSEQAKDLSISAKNTSIEQANNAAISANNAEISANNAEISETNAMIEASKSLLERNLAENAKNISIQSSIESLISENNAKTSELNALNYAGICSLSADIVSISPTGMILEYRNKITIGNTVGNNIKATLLGVYYYKNILYLGDDNSVNVTPDGQVSVKKIGVSKIHVIPTQNTSLYQSITIEVVAPSLRKVSPTSFRLSSSGNLRLT